MATVIALKGAHEAPKSVRSKMETLIFDRDQIETLRVPPWQRPLRVNDKVRALAEDLKVNGGVLPGILTIGKVSNDPASYICDGQHRIEAFKISGLDEFIADFRICQFDSMGEMADEFVNLNSRLVNMRPDDILRGLEGSTPILQTIREDCPFVGYDQIRRGTASPILSMSAVIRCWYGSQNETPTSNTNGKSAALMARELEPNSAKDLVHFLLTAHAAWGRDPEYFRLWGNLNVTMCMWLYRHLVMQRDRGVKRYVVLNVAQFKQCLMAVSASPDYLDWLYGRLMGDRDRSPCYARLKAIFVRRLSVDAPGSKPKLPQPAWAA